jgi:DNA-binding NtrC family response regulator
VDPLPALVRAGASAAGSDAGIEPWHHFKERTERAYILQALRHFEGNISEAARQLQVERQTIHKWLKSYQIERAEY